MYEVGSAKPIPRVGVLSIEKNRNGVDTVDLELLKCVEHPQFEGLGQAVTEQLADERSFIG